MSLWGSVFAAGYDRVMAGPEKATLRGHRKALLSQASGRVVEIGGGTGANLPFYGERVKTLTIAEPEAPMARRLERHVRELSSKASVVHAAAESSGQPA
jgi:16S rRNA A1518/A1519 N6-dimethyltransferase RsmA/KsgA/DIM1 with predicted DNA glycosylase/AP lyase activity